MNDLVVGMKLLLLTQTFIPLSIYQLAIASSVYNGEKEMSEMQREDIEKDLTFAGCINFQNTMKPETPAVIAEVRFRIQYPGIRYPVATGQSLTV
jgi:magnesium-transporting ATPase (P-type)